MTETVSVILPVRNEKKYISACLDSILNQDYPMDKLEIAVVDGMSEDGTRNILNDYAKRYANMKIIDNPDKIAPTAFNLGIKNATGDVMAIVSAHSELSKDYISSCIRYLKKTNAENVGGPMRAVGHDYISNAIAFAYNSPFGLGGGKFHDENFEGYVDTVYPGCWPKQVFEKVGLFDEMLVRNQDIAFNSRIRSCGGKIFLTPMIKSQYYCRSNLKDLWVQSFRTGLWNIKTVKIVPGSLSIRHFVPLIFVLSLLTAWLILPLWFLIISCYLLCTIYFALKTAAKHGLRFLLIMPIVFIAIHVSYGIGLLVGIFNPLCRNSRTCPPKAGEARGAPL